MPLEGWDNVRTHVYVKKNCGEEGRGTCGKTIGVTDVRYLAKGKAAVMESCVDVASLERRSSYVQKTEERRREKRKTERRI